MSDTRKLVIGEEPSGFWTLRENGELAAASESYNEVCKAVNTFARFYEERGITFTVAIKAEVAINEIQ